MGNKGNFEMSGFILGGGGGGGGHLPPLEFGLPPLGILYSKKT